MKHFEAAIKKIRPLSLQELNMYKTISEQFGKPQMSRAGGENGRGEGKISSSLPTSAYS
jgi:hypothetical protein